MPPAMEPFAAGKPSAWLPCATTRAAARPPRPPQAGLCPLRLYQRHPARPPPHPGRGALSPLVVFASFQGVPHAPSSHGLNQTRGGCPMFCPTQKTREDFPTAAGARCASAACAPRGAPGLLPPIGGGGGSIPHLATLAALLEVEAAAGVNADCGSTMWERDGLKYPPPKHSGSLSRVRVKPCVLQVCWPVLSWWGWHLLGEKRWSCLLCGGGS